MDITAPEVKDDRSVKLTPSHAFHVCAAALITAVVLSWAGAVQSVAAVTDSASGATAPPGPLKVFILAGQSNMQGHAHVRTIDAMELDPTSAPLLARMRNADGSTRVCGDVWISSIGSASEEQTGRLTTGFGAGRGGPKIGPEFTFGITLEGKLDEPILIIKTAWGGRSLHTDFRPPSAGPYMFNETQREEIERKGDDVDARQTERTAASGVAYREMMSHVRGVLDDIPRVYPQYDADAGFELAGFVWFQGWNDMVDSGVYPDRGSPGGYDMYSDLLATFIRDVRRDLLAPELPFVIGVMGVGGPTDQYPPSEQRHAPVHQNFRDTMAAPASMDEFAGRVVAVRTETCWDMEVAALRQRERTLKPRVDEIHEALQDGSMERGEAEAALQRIDSEAFTENELVLLRNGTSNADYHYMGSAKVMARIGVAFADAMLEVMKNEPSKLIVR